MIIAVSGSVGSGKTTFAKELGRKLDFEVIHLNEWAEKFKIEDIDELQTFDFDLNRLLDKLESFLRDNEDKNFIIESHFAHFIYSDLADVLIILTRDLKDLKKVYEERGYNEKKISDNLEVESFNLCFYEAQEEGYEPEQIILLENKGSLNDLVEKAVKKIKSLEI
ncbi:MAG: AAA family ATPase [Nanoarchaeota archaeon]